MPKFYTRFRRDVKYPSKFYAKFHDFAEIPMPKSRAKFHDLSKIHVKFNGANLRHGVNLRQIWHVFGACRLDVAKFYSYLREPHVPVCSPRPASFRPACLAPPHLVPSTRLASLRLAPVKTSKFFHSALEFLRFVASRPDRFVSCSRACRLVSAYLDRARSYRIRGGFLYKFCFF